MRTGLAGYILQTKHQFHLFCMSLETLWAGVLLASIAKALACDDEGKRASKVRTAAADLVQDDVEEVVSHHLLPVSQAWRLARVALQHVQQGTHPVTPLQLQDGFLQGGSRNYSRDTGNTQRGRKRFPHALVPTLSTCESATTACMAHLPGRDLVRHRQVCSSR